MKIHDPGNRPITQARMRDIMRSKRVAVIKGQDGSRYTDFYHQSLTLPWSVFFLGLLALFIVLNLIFAALYMADPKGFANVPPGDFWSRFVFSVQTMGSVPSEITVRTRYIDVITMIEAFIGILYIGFVTAIMFARFSRPSARVVFSKYAIIAPFDGEPTLMFRAANQRGNQVLDASVNVTLARQAVSREGIEMRRFEELQLVRARTSLFALSWTIMHRIDKTSPLHGMTPDMLYDAQMELIVLLSGTDDTLADTIYARYAYSPDEIRWNHRFVDVLSISPEGRRVVDLTKFHDTEPHPLESLTDGG